CRLFLAVGGFGHRLGRRPVVHVVPVVPDGFRARGGRRRRRWRCETDEQPRCEYRCCAPAGFDFHVAISPLLPVPDREKRPLAVSTAGQKQGIVALQRAKAGQKPRGLPRASCFRWRNRFGINGAGASRGDGCYEPVGADGQTPWAPPLRATITTS